MRRGGVRGTFNEWTPVTAATPHRHIASSYLFISLQVVTEPRVLLFFSILWRCVFWKERHNKNARVKNAKRWFYCLSLCKYDVTAIPTGGSRIHKAYIVLKDMNVCIFIIQQKAHQYNIHHYSISIATCFGDVAPSAGGRSHFRLKNSNDIWYIKWSE